MPRLGLPSPRGTGSPMIVSGKLPAFPAILLAAAGLMLVPAAHAAQLEDWRVARTFLYHGGLLAVVAIILGIGLANYRPYRAERYQLLTLLLSYLLLPLALALPVRALTSIPFHDAWFEMLSSLTTTGATVFDRYWLVAPSIHLWRGLVGWGGGLMILVAAFAVLAPLNLGGFEIVHRDRADAEGRRSPSLDLARERIRRSIRTVAPVYAVFTFTLAVLLMIAGDEPIVAFCHAMATVSTSGISPVGGLANGPGGIPGEAMMAVFLLPAVTHHMLSFRLWHWRQLSFGDPEIQLMLIAVLAVTAVLSMRAFLGAVEAERATDLLTAGQALWGSLFTVLSHLTTTGFESRHWMTMETWSGLSAPGTILLGAAIMGGGIATTAGGVKLLRLHTLYRHGMSELGRLVHPSNPGRRSGAAGTFTSAGTRIAFVFLMLFLISIAVVTIALAATGIAFERGLVLAVAGLTTTGPAIAILDDGTTYRELGPAAQVILGAAMIIGRMEALVIIALFNPAYWRK